ncbi:hypothetical protein [uncultured Mycobacterium sp.]|uniref:hypothetical protein n=1 Tax=uncultured Mycobacterium sp. TaxID=171292 RepID=UPI0035CC75DB
MDHVPVLGEKRSAAAHRPSRRRAVIVGTSNVVVRQEVLDVLQAAKQSGKTRLVGYSADGSAARTAVDTDAVELLQNSINIADQEAIDLTVPLCVERDISVIAK